jgi:hypothetical protein
MKIILKTVMALMLLLAGFAAGFPLGQERGFETGSEWALMQADVIAQEAGVFMPVSYSEGQFRVVKKQPPGLYKRAWQLADKYDAAARMLEAAAFRMADRTCPR